LKIETRTFDFQGKNPDIPVEAMPLSDLATIHADWS
jgi:hypothetical protein